MRIRRSLWVAVLAVSCIGIAFGQGGQLPTTAPVAIESSRDGEDATYRIGPGDLLSVQFFNRAQLSRDVKVDEHGMIRLPLINEDIAAACQTEKELASVIAQKYQDNQLLKNPSVSVSVKEYQSQPVAVLGAVKDPGRFVLQKRIRLLELVFLVAGGPTEGAGRKVRLLSTQPTTGCAALNERPRLAVANNDSESGNSTTLDLIELSLGKSANPFVRQGDIITIPAAEEAIVVGNVARPAAVPILEPLTLSRAIAMVGGVLPNSKKEKIRITRRLPDSVSTTELLVDLKDKDKSKGTDFLLQGGDIVEVSTKTGLEAVLTGVAKSMIQSPMSYPIRFIP